MSYTAYDWILAMTSANRDALKTSRNLIRAGKLLGAWTLVILVSTVMAMVFAPGDKARAACMVMAVTVPLQMPLIAYVITLATIAYENHQHLWMRYKIRVGEDP